MWRENQVEGCERQPASFPSIQDGGLVGFWLDNRHL